MAEYRHPRAMDDVEGTVPAAVGLHGEHVPIDEDGAFTSENETAVRALASAYDLTLADLRVGDSSDTCEVVKNDGDVCGRERPCSYHD